MPLDPASPPPRALAPAVRYWIGVLVALTVLFGLVMLRERPPAAVAASAPATAFSAARAWPTLLHLTDTIGYRTAGTAGADSAAAYLVRRLSGIPGLQVERQRADGVMTLGGRTVAYSVTNVLARLRGSSPDAVLVSAHYDSPAGSVGAADDGIAVAAMVEMARALAAGPPLAHSVILVLNDAEEQGLLGSHAFTRHPWVRDVKAFVNLESAGTDGKAILFQAGPQNSWLTQVYADAVPYPYGSVIGQDIFQSGFIPSDTDFRIYRDFAGLRGLDIALYQGGYAYHTERDRSWNVSPGSMQQVGANALALVRALAAGPLPGNIGGAPSVYYDVLGFMMFAYPATRALLLAILVSIAGMAVLVFASRRLGVTARQIVRGTIASMAAFIAAMVAGLLAGLVPLSVLHRTMGWYAHPWPGMVAFAALALAAMLLVYGLLFASRSAADDESRPPRRPALAAWMGMHIVWTILLLLSAAAHIGSGYIALWWVAGSGAALLLFSFGRRPWCWAALLLLLPALVMSAQLAVLLLRLFIPVMGRLPLAVSPDVVVALLVAAMTWIIAQPAVAGAARARRVRGTGSAGRLRGAALVALIIGLGALAITTFRFPYTTLRAKRLAVVQMEPDGPPASSSIVIRSGDFRPPTLATAQLRDRTVAPPGGSAPPGSVTVPAEPSGVAAPTLELLSDRVDSASHVRRLELRARAPGAYRMGLSWPAARVAGWSLGEPLPDERGGRRTVSYVAPPDSGWRITLQARGTAPLELRVTALRRDSTASLRAVMSRLPKWTDYVPLLSQTSNFRF